MTGPTLTARTTSIPLYQGDDLDRIEQLRGDLARAKASASNQARIGDTDGDIRDASAALEAAVADAAPRAVVVVLKALGRRQWRSLVEAHPAREANKDDESLGVNGDTFPDALLAASVSEPQFQTPADRGDFLDSLSDADFTRLWRAAFVLNRVPADDPKDLLAFEQIRASDET